VAVPPPALAAAREAIERARAGGQAVILAATVPAAAAAPLDRIRPEDPRPHVAWSARDGELDLAGTGASVGVEASGAAAVHEAISRVESLLSRVVTWGAPPGAVPRFLGGAAYDPAAPAPSWRGFPDAWFVLPRVLFWRRGASHGVTIQLVVEPGASEKAVAYELAAGLGLAERAPRVRPPLAPAGRRLDDPEAETRWSAGVTRALAEIAAGRLSKVVLARAIAIGAEREIDAAAVLRTLAETAGDCFCFLIDRGETAFVGASPERLLRVEGDRVVADCIAGTAPRGRDPALDQALARELAASEKERREHRHVVDWVQAVLERHCTSVETGERPEVLSLATLHHLSLPISGTLRPDADLGSVLADLHPTPAVGGLPRREALAFIRRAEREGRGWYAGPVGVIEPGRAEFAVAIRSALIRGRNARVFAGGGIVEGSRPEIEWLETEAKAAQLVALLSRRSS
jgi:isochorismate synthase